MLLSILNYASVSTETSVLIIGGWTEYERSSSIVEYKDDKWSLIGNLKQARKDHQAILMNSLILIIGGDSNNEL